MPPQQIPPCELVALTSLSPLSLSLSPLASQKGDGTFDPNAIKMQWNRSCGIETVLLTIKGQMSKSEYRKLAQPPEGSNY